MIAGVPYNSDEQWDSMCLYLFTTGAHRGPPGTAGCTPVWKVEDARRLGYNWIMSAHYFTVLRYESNFKATLEEIIIKRRSYFHFEARFPPVYLRGVTSWKAASYRKFSVLSVVSFRDQMKLEPRPDWAPLNFPTSIYCLFIYEFPGLLQGWISFTYFLYDILLIVISERSAQLVIIHSRALFELSPAFGHLFLITKFELAFLSLCPHY